MSKDPFNGNIKKEHINYVKFFGVFAPVLFFAFFVFFLFFALLYEKIEYTARIFMFIFSGICLVASFLCPAILIYATSNTIRNFLKRYRIIKKAVAKTVSTFTSRTPRIYRHYFYGAFDSEPRNLVVWYIFKTDADLETAKSSGFCAELEATTIDALIHFGYPKEAFELTKMDVPDFTFGNGTEEEHQKFLDLITYRKAMISFTSKEDIDRETDGNYHLYFQ